MTATDIRSRSMVEVPAMTPLQTALLEARIPILDSDDVAQFQAQRLAEEQAKLSAACRYRWADTVVCVSLVGFVISFAVVLEGHLAPGAALLTCMVCGLVVSVLSHVLYKFERCHGVPVYKVRLLAWRPIYAGRCADGVRWFHAVVRGGGLRQDTALPPEARERMIAISETGVSASFEVEQLDVDPFLWVYAACRYRWADTVACVCGGCRGSSASERYCIAVWDERGFIQ